MAEWLSENEPLSKHSYYRIGGPARWFALPKTQAELKEALEFAASKALPVFILGAGSNLLVSDSGFQGLVLKVTRLDIGISLIAPDRIQTGSGVAVSTLLRKCAQEGWGGLEFLSGVPGSIGGVVTMNAGTHLGEAKAALKRVEAFLPESAEMIVFEGAELRFQYRKNLFLPSGAIVLRADWQVTPGDVVEIKARLDETLARRKATQPIDYPSCGSVFKNPKESGVSAWQVVDRLGLRGHRIGDAQFSEKHSNFIINLGAARAADVRALIELVKARALSELGIKLEEEVAYLGNFDSIPSSV